MKYKTLIIVLLICQTIAFFMVTVTLMETTIDGGIVAKIGEIQKSPVGMAIVILMIPLFLTSILFSMLLCGRLSWLSKVEVAEDELYEQKQKYKQATEAIIKTFKIQSNDLLN